MEYRSSCFGEGAGHTVPMVGKCLGRGCCFGAQTRARSDCGGSEVEVHRKPMAEVEGRLPDLAKVVFVWL